MTGLRIPWRTTVLVAVAAVVLGALIALLPAPRASAGEGMAADVQISRFAYEGPRGTILADLRLRCAPGYEFAELALDFSQGGVTTPSLLGQPVPCDGRWHDQRVSSLEAFEAGWATLTARLTVVDAVTGEPAPEAVATRAIYVRPAAAIVLPRTVHLLPGGQVRLTVRARCDVPWVLQDFSVTLTQGEFPAIASADAYLDLTCDGALHSTTVLLGPSTVPFQEGPARIDASITLLDPEQFDPVTQATATGTVRVR